MRGCFQKPLVMHYKQTLVAVILSGIWEIIYALFPVLNRRQLCMMYIMSRKVQLNLKFSLNNRRARNFSLRALEARTKTRMFTVIIRICTIFFGKMETLIWFPSISVGPMQGVFREKKGESQHNNQDVPFSHNPICISKTIDFTSRGSMRMLLKNALNNPMSWKIHQLPPFAFVDATSLVHSQMPLLQNLPSLHATKPSQLQPLYPELL